MEYLPSKDFTFGGRELTLELVKYAEHEYGVELWDNNGGWEDAQLLYGADFLSYEEALAEYLRVDSDPAAVV